MAGSLRRAAELLACAFALASCTIHPPDLRRTFAARPREYWVVAPPERECLPELQLLLEHKRAEGLHVELVGLDPARTSAANWERVRARLAARPGREPAFLLVLATPQELAMGPWTLEEGGARVASDLPLALELPLEEARTLSRAELERPPRWIVGRVPWAERAVVARALRSASEYADGTRERSALLGARRFLLPGDSSAALARARAELVRFGVDGELWADAPPRDRALGECTRRAERTVWIELHSTQWRVHERADDAPYGSTLQPARVSELVSTDFVERWVEREPALVYLLAHANSGLHSMGRALLGTSVLAGWDARAGGARAPQRPALLLASGCAIGDPAEPLLRELFARGFVAACAASTAENGPLPLGPALDAERDVAAFLAQGAPLGSAAAWTKRVYDRAARRTLSWWLWPFAREIWATNLASYVVYGDPALALPPRD